MWWFCGVRMDQSSSHIKWKPISSPWATYPVHCHHPGQGVVVEVHLYWSRLNFNGRRWCQAGSCPNSVQSWNMELQQSSMEKVCKQTLFFVTMEKYTKRKQKAFMCVSDFGNKCACLSFNGHCLTCSCPIMVMMRWQWWCRWCVFPFMFHLGWVNSQSKSFTF